MSAPDVASPLWKRLGGATLNYGLGSLLPQVLSFLLVPVFTAFLSPDDYGVLDLAAAFAAVLVMVMRIGLPGAVTRFYFEYGEGPGLRDYLTSMGWFLLAASSVVLAGTLAVMPLVGRWVTPGLDFPVVLLVCLSTFFAGNSELQRRLLQAREQSRYTMMLNLASAVAIAGLSIVFVAGFGFGADGMLFAEMVINVVLFAQATHYLRRDLTGQARWASVRGSVRYALGVLPSQVIGTVSQVATRSILVGVQSLEALGLVALASRFARPLSIVILAFGTAYQPLYFEARTQGTAEAHERLARVTGAVWLLSVWGCVVIATLGPIAVVLLTPERFHAAAHLIPWLAVGWFGQLLSVIGTSEISFQKATWFIPIATVMVIVTSLGATVVLAGRWGAVGMSIANAITLWVNGGLHFAFSLTKVRLPLRWWSLGRATALALAIGAVAVTFPGEGLPMRLVMAVGASAALPMLLLALRDPMAFEAMAFVRARFRRRS